MKLSWTFFGVFSVAIAVGCGGSTTGGNGGSGSSSPGGSGTGTDTQSGSSTGTCPSYASEVSGIVATHCASCHSGQFDTYAGLSASSQAVEGAVNAGAMPPSSGTPLSAADKATLLAWIACGSPDN